MEERFEYTLKEKLEQKNIPGWKLQDGIFLGLAVVIGYLLVNWVLGAGFKLGFTIVYALILLWTGVYTGKRSHLKKPLPLFCAATSMAAAVLFARTADEVLLFLWFFGILFLYAIFAVSISGTRDGFRPMDALFTAICIPFSRFHMPFLSLYARENRLLHNKGFHQFLIGLALAVPVLVVVLPLLTESDAAFEGLIQTLLRNTGSGLFRLVLALVLALLLFSLGFALRKQLVPKNTEAEPLFPQCLSKIAAVTLMAVLLFIYAAYLLSQLAYFFSAFSGILPPDFHFSAAEYARRGFFELCAVCCINLALILAVMKLVRQDASGNLPRSVRIAGIAVGAVCLVFLATALSKMALYVDRFGLTRLRLLTSAFMVFLGVVLLCTMLRLPARRFPAGQVVLAFGCILGLMLGYAEPDALIARYNIHHYQTGDLAEIDVGYLASLSDDAVPELVALLKTDDPEVRRAAGEQLYNRLMDFCGLESGTDIGEIQRMPDVCPDFPSYNRSRIRAMLALWEVRNQLAECATP